jgi:hypothetical protein
MKSFDILLISVNLKIDNKKDIENFMYSIFLELTVT